MNSEGGNWRKGHNVGSFITGAWILVIAGYVFWSALQDRIGFGLLAVLILVSLVTLVGIMNLLSYSAKTIGIADAKQAFGLPEGSVRAILTMAFIVLVGVLASYLVVNSSERSPYARIPIVIAQNVSLDQAREIQKTFSAADGIVTIVPLPKALSQPQPPSPTPLPQPQGAQPQPTPSAPLPQPQGAQPPPGQPPAGQQQTPQPPAGQPQAAPPAAAQPAPGQDVAFEVRFYPKVDHRLGEDISKQILTMLSTILAAMIGFYFGARPGESDPGAVKWTAAAANIDRLLATSPKVSEVNSSADTLLAGKLAAADKQDQRKKVDGLKAELPGLKSTLENAQIVRFSVGVTVDQLDSAAAAASKAATRLQEIDKELKAIDSAIK